MVDSIKITALQDIGANIAYTTLVPVVNMAGTPVTQKSNLQNLGNLILNGAGGSYFPRAAQANLALSVANAAQPNITSVGTLTSLAVTGNITAGNINGGNIVVANFFYGDGGFLTNVASNGSNYSNSNVAAYLPTYTGNISGDYLTLTHDVTANVVDANFLYGDASNVTNLPVGNIAVINLDGNASNVLRGTGTWGPDANSSYGNANVANYLPNYTGAIGANLVTSNTNLQITTSYGNSNITFTFGAGGALYWPAPGGNTWAIEPNGDGEFEIKSTTNVVISTDISNANSHFTFDSEGIFTAPSNVNLLGSRLNVGPDAANAANLLNPTLVIANSGAGYIQAAIINNDETGSSDWSADGAGGGDDEAWTDMGFAGYGFSDANYTVTGPGDGYLFVQGYANGLGGNMVLATGDHSNTADIIFATGGFLSNNEFARIDHANDVFHLTRANSGIKFADGTIQTTAGGLPLANGNSNINIATSNGNVTINVGGEHTFTFDTDGSLSFPTNNLYINGDASLFGSNTAIIQTGSNIPLALIADGANSSIDSVWISNIANIGNANIAAMYINPDAAPGSIRIVAGNNASNVYIWDFSNDGLFTLPDGAIIDTIGNNFEVRAIENVNFEANAVVNIYTDGSGNAYQWQFGDDGNLTLPTNGSIIVDGGDGVIGPVSDDLVISWDNEDIRLVSVQSSIEMQADAAFRVQTNYDGANVLYASRWEFTNNEIVNISNNFGIVSEAGNLNLSGGRDGVNSGNTTISAVATGVAVSTWTFDNTGNLTLPGNTFAVNYANGTPVSLGGGNTGNVTFSNVTVQGDNNGLNLSAGSDFTANLAYLQVRAGDVASHIHLDTGNNSAYDLIVGDDQNYVQVSSTGNILLSSYDSNTAQYTWTLDYNGNLILAGGNSVIQSIANSSLDPLNPNVSTMVLTPDANYNSQVLVLDPTAPGHIHLRAYAFSNIDDPSANIFLGGEDTSFEITSGSNNQAVIHSGGNDWVFDNTGNLIVPGASGGVIKTVANGAIAIAAIDGGSNNPAQVISFNANGTPTTAISAYASEATIQANINGSIQTWAFNNAGNLVLPGNTLAINYANGTAAFGNIVSVNKDGNSSNVLYGNGVFAAAPGGSSYGDSNVTTLLGSFGSNTISTTGNISGGNVTASGTSSNLIRRAFGLVASDVGVTLDDLTVTVSSATSQLTLSTSGSWQGTGWTETFAGGATPTVNSWVNLPLNPGFNNASGAMTSQGNGCRCVISDQTPSAKVYQITVVRSGTSGAQWNISIERLV